MVWMLIETVSGQPLGLFTSHDPTSAWGRHHVLSGVIPSGGFEIRGRAPEATFPDLAELPT